MSKLKNISDQILVGNRFIEVGKSAKIEELRIKTNLDSIKNSKVLEKSVRTVTTQYYVSSSPNELEDGEWLDERPEEYEGYLWTRNKYEYANGKIELSRPTYQLKTSDVDTSFTITSYYLRSQYSTGITKETTGWSTTMPELTPTYKYMWYYEHYTYASGADSTESDCYIICVYGDSGDDARVFDIACAENSFKRNLRLSGYNPAITFELDIQGYSASAVHSVTVTGSDGTVYINGDTQTTSYSIDTIPYVNSHDSITISATLSVSGTNVATASRVLNAIDETEKFIYGGQIDNTNDDDAEAIAYFTTGYGGVLEGDNYIDRTNKTIKYYNGTSWAVLSLANRRAGEILSTVETDFWVLFQNTSEAEKANLWSLYGHKKEIIASAIATSKLIMYGSGVVASANISTDPSEDIDAKGFLTKNGYRLEGANGVVRARTGYFKDIDIGGNARIGADAEVLGIIRNIDESGEVAFETVKDVGQSATYTASKIDGTSVQTEYPNKEWVDYLDTYFQGHLTSKQDYTVDSCKLVKSDSSVITAMGKICYFDSVSGSQSHTYYETLGGDSSTVYETLFSNTHNTNVTVSSITAYDSVIKRSSGYYLSYGMDVYVLDSDGNTVERIMYLAYRPNIRHPGTPINQNSTSAYNISVPPNGSIVRTHALYEDCTFYAQGYATVTYNESANFSVGVWVLDGATKSLITDYLMYSGFSTVDNTSIAINAINFTRTLAFSANASWSIDKYYTFAWTNAPSNVNTITTSLFGAGNAFTYDGNSISIAYVKYAVGYLEIVDSNNVSYIMTGTYVREHSVNLVIVPCVTGARAQNLMPVFDGGNRVGSGNVGTQTESWYIGWAASGWQQGSKRDMKENIYSLEKDVLPIINSVDIVSFNLKSDRGKEERYTHYGFIADDTAEELSTPFHDRMDYGSCIGILIKAVQELSAEVEELKSKVQSS